MQHIDVTRHQCSILYYFCILFHILNSMQYTSIPCWTATDTVETQQSTPLISRAVKQKCLSKDQAYPTMLSAQDTSYTAFGVKANAARGQSKDERFTLFPLGSAARQTPRKRIGARTGGREEREEICTSHPVCICLSVSLSLARRLNNRQEESRDDIQSHLSER